MITRGTRDLAAFLAREYVIHIARVGGGTLRSTGVRAGAMDVIPDSPLSNEEIRELDAFLYIGRDAR